MQKICTSICWICGKLIDGDEKARDHCHITGKYRGAAHWNCNINFKITKKVPVIFHNLKGYDSHLVFKELSKFNGLKISVIQMDWKNIWLLQLIRTLLLLTVCNL